MKVTTCLCSNVDLHDELGYTGFWTTGNEPPLPWVTEGTFGCAFGDERGARIARGYFHFDRFREFDIAEFTADFYLSSFLDKDDDLRCQTLKRGSSVFVDYLNVAIAHELNHHRKVRQHWFQAEGRSLYGWMKLCQTVGLVKAAEYASEIFNESIWMDRSYGGHRWGMAAKRLYQYLSGELPSALFIDSIFNLQHNTGHILSKVEWKRFADLDTVLTAHGDAERYTELLLYASPEVRRAVGDSLQSLIQQGDEALLHP